MAWTRIAVALLITICLTGSPAGRRPAVDLGPLRYVVSDRVEAFLPPKWEFKPFLGPPRDPLRGIRASSDLTGWTPHDLTIPGLEAYWIDATEVGVSSDYYQLAARGPVADLFDSRPDCHSVTRLMVLDHADPSGLAHGGLGQYIATATGTCTSSSRTTRWASVVAAPGFSSVREIGIPQSGLYVVSASVREGPDARDRLSRLMSGVSFGGTPVPAFLTAAGFTGKLL